MLFFMKSTNQVKDSSTKHGHPQGGGRARVDARRPPPTGKKIGYRRDYNNLYRNAFLLRFSPMGALFTMWGPFCPLSPCGGSFFIFIGAFLGLSHPLQKFLRAAMQPNYRTI